MPGAVPALRPATPADLPAIRRIVDAAYGPYIPLTGRPPAPMRADYAHHVTLGEAFVLPHGKRIVALSILIDRPDALLIDNLAVDPALQGRGLGRALLNHAERVARARGFTRLTLYTNVAMARNVSIYRAAGFAEISRGWRDGFHRIDMEKRL